MCKEAGAALAVLDARGRQGGCELLWGLDSCNHPELRQFSRGEALGMLTRRACWREGAAARY